MNQIYFLESRIDTEKMMANVFYLEIESVGNDRFDVTKKQKQFVTPLEKVGGEYQFDLDYFDYNFGQNIGNKIFLLKHQTKRQVDSTIRFEACINAGGIEHLSNPNSVLQRNDYKRMILNYFRQINDDVGRIGRSYVFEEYEMGCFAEVVERLRELGFMVDTVDNVQGTKTIRAHKSKTA